MGSRFTGAICPASVSAGKVNNAAAAAGVTGTLSSSPTEKTETSNTTAASTIAASTAGTTASTAAALLLPSSPAALAFTLRGAEALACAPGRSCFSRKPRYAKFRINESGSFEFLDLPRKENLENNDDDDDNTPPAHPFLLAFLPCRRTIQHDLCIPGVKNRRVVSIDDLCVDAVPDVFENGAATTRHCGAPATFSSFMSPEEDGASLQREDTADSLASDDTRDKPHQHELSTMLSLPSNNNRRIQSMNATSAIDVSAVEEAADMTTTDKTIEERIADKVTTNKNNLGLVLPLYPSEGLPLSCLLLESEGLDERQSTSTESNKKVRFCPNIPEEIYEYEQFDWAVVAAEDEHQIFMTSISPSTLENSDLLIAQQPLLLPPPQPPPTLPASSTPVSPVPPSQSPALESLTLPFLVSGPVAESSSFSSSPSSASNDSRSSPKSLPERSGELERSRTWTDGCKVIHSKRSGAIKQREATPHPSSGRVVSLLPEPHFFPRESLAVLAGEHSCPAAPLSFRPTL